MAKTKDSLGDRMKENYENRSKTYLTRRTPCIIRLDGKAFHTFTKGFNRPYDEIFHTAMNETTKSLCENIQGCKIGYTQSDEITLLLTDFETLTTDAWFGYSVQKICSIAAALATLQFNKIFRTLVNNYLTGRTLDDYGIALLKARDKGALFDARCFSVPKEEINNCFVWRQQDAYRNAVQMLGQTYFSSKQLDHKNINQIQEMLWQEKNVNFNDMPIPFKRGICVKRDVILKNNVERRVWTIDTEIPIFSKQPEYINNLIVPEGAA